MDPGLAKIISLTRETSRTGTATSRALSRLLAAASYTPKEVCDVAKAMSDLSVMLGYLSRDWDSLDPEIKRKKKMKMKKAKKAKSIQRKLPKPKLRRQIASALERINVLHGEIQALVDPGNAAARLLWAFRRTRWRTLLRQVESYKLGIRMICDILALTCQLKDLAEDLTTTLGEDIMNRWQETENTVQACHQFIKVTMIDLDHEHSQGAESQEVDSQEGIRDQDSDASQHILIKDAVTWLHCLVFSAMEAKHPLDGQGEGMEEDKEGGDTEADVARIDIMPASNQNSKLLSVIQILPNAKIVVNKLLSEWTTLPKSAIYMKTVDAPLAFDTPLAYDSDTSSSGSSSSLSDGGLGNPLDNNSDVRFIDARGRRYRIPWDVAKTWVGMEGLINQMFCRVPGLWPHVLNERFDLVRRDNAILMPHIYEKIIKPGDFILMRMWPPERLPSVAPPPPPGIQFPGGIPLRGPPRPGGVPVSPRLARGRTRRAPNLSGPVYVGN
ncbi:hypothetical protein PG990_003088 [Apiospora arundinis]